MLFRRFFIYATITVNSPFCLIGFFSKQLVLYSALQNGYYFISVLAIIVSVISCSYYLQIIKILITPSESEGPIQINFPSEGPSRIGVHPQGRTLLSLFREGVEVIAPPLSLYFNLNKDKKEGLQKNKKDPRLPFARSLAKARGQEIRYVNWSAKNEIILTNTHSYLISTLTFTILLFFIKPSLILNSTQLLSLSLFYI